MKQIIPSLLTSARAFRVTSRLRGAGSLTAVAALMMLIGGCMSGEYDRRMQETIDKMNAPPPAEKQAEKPEAGEQAS
jgi:hypothetical protein